ncbi:hypothetical protein [Citricoccus sp. GCM10030269]|uniref:hypothetical protein n=1 Tax=Citricoccus sp. GCM10030269 TaxID=3273388 RepID=UPI00360A92C0
MRTPKATFTTAADAVGAVSTVLGTLLVVAPQTAARRLSLPGSRDKRHRALGAADLGLGIAIMASRSAQWRWTTVAARSLLHLVFAREYLYAGNRLGAGAMGLLFVVDGGIAYGLRRSTRSVTC